MVEERESEAVMAEPERILLSQEELLLPCQGQAKIIKVQERESEAVTQKLERILPSAVESSLPHQV